MLKITSSAIEAIYSHGKKTSSGECCGLVVPTSLDEILTKVVECENIQDKLHEKDPVRYPITSESAYCLDRLGLMLIEDNSREEGYPGGIYHSHTNGRAYFSNEDKRKAMFNGIVLHPKAHYIVIGVKEGEISDTKSFIWGTEQQDFIEEPIEIIEQYNNNL